jgi:hypothetical protein
MAAFSGVGGPGSDHQDRTTSKRPAHLLRWAKDALAELSSATSSERVAANDRLRPCWCVREGSNAVHGLLRSIPGETAAPLFLLVLSEGD